MSKISQQKDTQQKIIPLTPGPDELPNLILKNAANEISPFLKIISDQSLQMGKFPDDWV